jgi:hypothetical protein
VNPHIVDVQLHECIVDGFGPQRRQGLLEELEMQHTPLVLGQHLHEAPNFLLAESLGPLSEAALSAAPGEEQRDRVQLFLEREPRIKACSVGHRAHRND